jgi:exoribonuclease-2
MKYRVIGLERRGELLLAVVIKQKEDKLDVYLESGEKVTVAGSKAIHFFSTVEASDEKSIKIALADTRDRFSQEVIDLAMLWECLEADISHSLPELLAAYFTTYGEKEAGALFVALSRDKHYFAWRDGGFVKTPPATVEVNLKREKAEKERHATESSVVSWLKGTTSSIDLTAEGVKKMMDALKKFALEGADSAPSEARRLAETLGMDADSLLDLLEEKGIIDPDVNEALYRFQLYSEYPHSAREEAQKIVASSSNLDGRAVIRDSWNIAIDDAETEEVDDALSYHQEDGCHVVGIHIADVACIVPPGGPLDNFARTRFATLYFPETRLPLFPFSLVKKKLTLSVREGRPTISGFFYFDDQGNLVRSYFAETVLVLSRRGTYEDTAGQLGEEPAFRKLHEIAIALRDKRVKAGAVITQLPDLKIKVKDGKVSLQLQTMDLPGHLVVSELMILFNSALGEKFMREAIPALFRVQSKKTDAQPEALNRDDPLYPLKLRWNMAAASLSITPAPHYSVGVPAYTWATSPIRRYSDLIAHRQLIATLHQNPLPYPLAVLEEMKMNLERLEKACKNVEIARNLYWIYKYLKNSNDKVYQAVVSRVLENQKVMVFIPELLQEFPFHAERLSDAQEGRALSLRVIEAYPRQKRIIWGQVTV